MRINRTMLGMLMIAIAIIGGGFGSAVAQTEIELTPVDDFSFVSPDGCIAEPANLSRIQALIESANDSRSTPMASQALLDGGEPVEGDEAGAVRALAIQVLACINANNPLRFLNLFSDQFFEHSPNDLSVILAAAEDQAAGEELLPLDDGYAIVHESDVFVLDDGRFTYTMAVAWVRPSPRSEAPVATDLIQVVARSVDGSLFVDDLRSETLEDPITASGCGEDCAMPQVTGEVYSGWIMPIDVSRENANWLVWGEEVIEVFEPTEDEITEAEASLVAYLQTMSMAQETGLLESVGNHERQYFGYETTNGRLLIVNGFCDRLGYDPATEVIAVEDGGSCFWQGRYNLDNSTWESVSINGEA